MFNTTTTDILNTVETQFSCEQPIHACLTPIHSGPVPIPAIGDFVGNQTMSLTDVWNSSVRGMVEEVSCIAEE